MVSKMPISPRKKRKTFVNIIARKCREFVANFRSQTLKFKWNFFWIGKGVRICYHKNPLWTQIPKWYINPYQKSQFLALFWKKLWGKIFLIKKNARPDTSSYLNETKPNLTASRHTEAAAVGSQLKEVSHSVIT